MAYVLAPDGTPGEVPDEQLQAALAQGYQQRAPTAKEQAQAAAAEQPLAAAGEALVRGVTAGFAEPLVRKAEAAITGKPEEQVAEEMRLRRQENPAAALVGEVGGTIGSFFVGPAGLVAKGLQGARAAGVAGRLAAGAAEGTLWGLGSAVSEATLENAELTGERLAASAAAGALTGGILDTTFYGIEKGTSALLKKAGAPSVRAMLEKAGDALSLSMIESKKWAKKYGTYEKDVLRVAREKGVLTKATALDQASVDFAEKQLADTGAAMERELIASQQVSPPKYSDLIDDVMGKLKENHGKLTLAEPYIDEVQNVLEANMAQNSEWVDLWRLQSEWRKKATTDTLHNEVIRDARIALRDYIAEKAPGDLAKMNREYAALNAFTEGLADAKAGYESRGIAGFKEQMGGILASGMAGGGVPGAVAAAGAFTAGKFARKRGGFLAGEALRELADSNAMQGVAKAFHGRVTQMLSTAPEMLGAFRATLESAAARGADDLLETHAQLASSSMGGDYMATVGLIPETPEEMQAASTRLAYLSAAKTAADQYEVALMNAADGILGAKAGRPTVSGPGALSVKQFDKMMGSIRASLNNPEAAFASIPAEISGTLPVATGHMTATLLRGLQFLDSKAPKSPYEGMPASVAPNWQPSATELDRFNRYKEAVENPIKVLNNIASGYMSPEQIEAVKAVYPGIYANLQQRLGERLAEIKKPLTYQQKLGLQLVMGPTALGMSPQQIQVLQQAQAGAGPQQGGMRKPDGRQTVDAQKNLQTQAQRMEAR